MQPNNVIVLPKDGPFGLVSVQRGAARITTVKAKMISKIQKAVAACSLMAAILAPSAQAAPYPCDMPPGPAQLCYGMKKMKATAIGQAVTAFNPTNSHSANIGFVGNNLDTAALNSLLAGRTGLVTRWWEQGGGASLDQITSAQSPNIGALRIGNTPALILRGSGVLGIPSGLETGNFSPLGLGITAKDYSIYAVVKPATSMAVNQASAPGFSLSALLELTSASPVTQKGTLAVSSFDVTGLADTTNINIGDTVAAGGVAIDADTQVAQVVNATTITLSKPALSSGTFLTPYFRAGSIFVQSLISTTFTAGSTTATMASTANLGIGDNVISFGVTFDYTNVASKTATTVTLNLASGQNGVTPLTFSRPIIRLYNNANGGFRGSWNADDGSPGFSFTSAASFVQTNPTVVAVTSNADGVRIYQDGYVISTAARSSQNATAQVLTLGRLASSVAGQSSRSFEGTIVALMIYNNGHSQADVGFVTAALQNHYGIDPSVATYSTNEIILTGDSISAGYQTVGTYGYLDYLQALVTKPARFLNFAVPGSSLTQNPSSSPDLFNQLALFQIAMRDNLPAPNAVKGRVFIIHGGGNDEGFGGTPRACTTAASSQTVLMSDTSGLNVGDFIGTFDSSIGAFATISAINPGVSVTSSVAATISETTLCYFTFSSRSPTVIYNSLQSLTNSAIAAGATKVIVSTILPRTDGWRQWRNSLNTLIKAGVTGATVVDCAAYSDLATIPGAAYQDSAHLTAYGHRLMAACLQSEVNSGLTFLLEPANDNVPRWLHKAA